MAPHPLPPLEQVDPAQAWQPWEPGSQDPWDRKWAGHLYRRAAFGANQAELEDAEKQGYKATLEKVLQGEPEAGSLHDFLITEGEKVARRNNAAELRGWWLYCMLNGGHPLRDKMTLFWHNHFATSIAKVQRTSLMFAQNRLLRAHALGKFGPFLQAMSKDVAMLVWLDSNSNVKAHPNENYAREVMELFSLGVGHYTEKDVREAARAFTGWHTDDDEFDYNPKFHDDGPKAVLGQTGNWNGDDVVRIILGRPDAARFLVRKLYQYLVSESQDPPEALLEPLAQAFRATDYDVAALVRTVLSSRHFFSGYAYRQRVKNPVEFALGAARAVVRGMIPQQALVSRIDAMGQQLFAPPNVKGWPGSRAWLNTSTVLARQNFSQALAMGTLWGNVRRPPNGPLEEIAELEATRLEAEQAKKAPGPAKAAPEEAAPAPDLDPAHPVRRAKLGRPEEVVGLLLDIYLPGGVSPAARARLVAFVANGKPTGPALDRRVRETVHAILSLPEYQLA